MNFNYHRLVVFLALVSASTAQEEMDQKEQISVDPVDYEIYPAQLTIEQSGEEISIDPADYEIYPVYATSSVLEDTMQQVPEDGRLSIDLLSALEVGECPEVTCRTPLVERMKSWLCEYTKYTAETVAWIREFEEWWDGCLESVDQPAFGSFTCPDNSMLECSIPGKRRCTDDRMGCTRCICADGLYKNTSFIFKLWSKEMELFKKRFAMYKERAQICTSTMSLESECDIDDDSGSVDDGSGSGEEFVIPGFNESGSGESSTMDDSGSGSGERSVVPASGDGDSSGSGDDTDVSGSGVEGSTNDSNPRMDGNEMRDQDQSYEDQMNMPDQ